MEKSMESYNSRFYQLMIVDKEQLEVSQMQVKCSILQQLQQCSRFVTVVKQREEIDTVSYHKLFDVLKQFQNEILLSGTKTIKDRSTIKHAIFFHTPSSSTKTQRNRLKIPQPKVNIDNQSGSLGIKDDDSCWARETGAVRSANKMEYSALTAGIWTLCQESGSKAGLKDYSVSQGEDDDGKQLHSTPIFSWAKAFTNSRWIYGFEGFSSELLLHHLTLKESSCVRLNLLHMDLCGPMRVASINGKKYILVIVDDYSRYTWTLFLRSKDETPEVLEKTFSR
ncbi:retrovirus-related pol polyprotein from transposon TNT 1-94 [Tanacetum coccineum]